jgi:hypothetical protein
LIDADHYKELLRGIFCGKKIILAVDVLVGAGPQVELMRSLGAEVVLAISGTHGTGATPDLPHVLLASDGKPLMVENIRSFERALQNLPDEARDAMDRADPHHEALILGSFFTPPDGIEGRRVYGGRPHEWSALEDKAVVDAFFDRAGIARAPSRVIAAPELDEVDVVASGDAKEGFNGGADYVRWIRNDDDLAEAKAFFTARCDRVRLMPFLEGIPCSIHGVVIGDEVIALRPAEMLTLRRPTSRFLYAGCATYWDPPDDDRAYMRDVARRVGVALRDAFGYRGAFTVDGVVTADGFRPTELNPRAGAASGALTNPSGVPFQLLNKAMIENEELDYRAAELEELLVTTADGQRAGGAYSSFAGPAWEQQTHEMKDGTITLGPSGMGRFALYSPKAGTVPIGPSFAPRAVEAFAYMDETFGTAFGPLEAAKPAR